MWTALRRQSGGDDSGSVVEVTKQDVLVTEMRRRPERKKEKCWVGRMDGVNGMGSDRVMLKSWWGMLFIYLTRKRDVQGVLA